MTAAISGNQALVLPLIEDGSFAGQKDSNGRGMVHLASTSVLEVFQFFNRR